jgi:lipopolysaccharide biosynthesis glycosyltransferase
MQHLAAALASLLENNSGMNIYVINTDINEADWKKLSKLFFGKDSILINAKIDDGQIKNLVTCIHLTKASYYRLFIPEIVPGDKALYLDADIVVTQRIDDLYDTDISNTFLAAVDNPGLYDYRDLEMDPSAKFFNSGVMLINLEYWRNYKVKEKVVNFIRKKPEVIRFTDQDGLNSVINGNWLELHPKYNMHTGFVYTQHTAESIIKEGFGIPVIIHYTSSSKPWHLGNNHPYKHLYWKYLRMTPYKFAFPSKPWSIFDFDNLMTRVPMPIKEALKKILRRRD